MGDDMDNVGEACVLIRKEKARLDHHWCELHRWYEDATNERNVANNELSHMTDMIERRD